jgi:hypothetical protein
VFTWPPGPAIAVETNTDNEERCQDFDYFANGTGLAWLQYRSLSTSSAMGHAASAAFSPDTEETRLAPRVRRTHSAGRHA